MMHNISLHELHAAYRADKTHRLVAQGVESFLNSPEAVTLTVGDGTVGLNRLVQLICEHSPSVTAEAITDFLHTNFKTDDVGVDTIKEIING